MIKSAISKELKTLFNNKSVSNVYKILKKFNIDSKKCIINNISLIKSQFRLILYLENNH